MQVRVRTSIKGEQAAEKESENVGLCHYDSALGGRVFSGLIYHDKGGLDNPVPLFKSIGEGRDEFGVESTSM